jgi:hypothetical protein
MVLQVRCLPKATDTSKNGGISNSEVRIFQSQKNTPRDQKDIYILFANVTMYLKTMLQLPKVERKQQKYTW